MVSSHSEITPREASALVEHINEALSSCSDVKNMLPIDSTPESIVSAIHNGDQDITVNFKDDKSKRFRMLENHFLCLDAARRMGCITVNIGPL
ncbi:hypothetical protein ROZALSC1DRAFT_29439, partial [Rozella allomycis CSF55]